MKYAVVFLAALAACDGGQKDSGSGDTPAGDPRIDSYTPTCLDDDTYYGELITTSLTNGVGILNLWETGAPTEDDFWNEEHDLISTGSGEFGESLDVTLTMVPYPEDVVSSSTTLFSCADVGQFEGGATAADTLTYAIRIYDTDGVLSDCIAFGHEPSSVVDGSIAGLNSVSASSELSSCFVM